MNAKQLAASQQSATECAALNITRRLTDLDWENIEQGLWERGYVKTAAILTRAECDQLVDLYVDDTRFRSRVEMARYGFGMGEYKYFANPLPPIVQELRTEAYGHLASVADRWMEALGTRQRYPPDLSAFIEICATRGQPKPAPLLLRYGEGDYNCLHKDVLGDVVFPFQITCALSRRNVDYSGGEFLFVEQGRSAQSRGEVVTLEQGEFVIFTTDCRPAVGKRGYRRMHLRHGVSRITSGRRYSLGVIFHNSK